MPSHYLLAALLLLAPAVHAQERIVPTSKQQVTLTFAPVVKQAAPAVVNIFTERRVQTQGSPFFNDPFFQQFFGNEAMGVPRERVERSLGSGVIIRGSGIVVTNHHVAGSADQIRVVLTDGREFPAKIVGTDERSDLCVLQLQDVKDTLPALELSDSDQLQVGDMVLAIGNPFDVGQTVTSGIVSALARSKVGVGDFRSFIQTDAAINPGNSGGALITSEGRLIGINTAIYSRSGGSIGIGFAIPSTMVKTVVASILKEGRAIRPWVGAVWQSVTPDLARNLGLARPRGAAVTQVLAGSPGARAGLKAGDVVVKLNAHEVGDEQDLRYQLATLPVGGTAKLTVNRNGADVSLTLPLQAPPDTPTRDTRTLVGRQPLSGATVSNLNPALADEMGIPYTEPGVVVNRSDANSFAGRFGLKPGDMILDINGQPVKKVEDLNVPLRESLEGWVITVGRDGRAYKLQVDN